jgi:hypothetical protein
MMRVATNLVHLPDKLAGVNSGQRLTVAICLVCSLVGCSSTNTSTPTRTPAPKSAQTHVERGPVKVSVELTPLPVYLSDEPRLVVSIDFETGVEIEKPPFGEAVGDFLIRDFHEPLPEVHGNREVVRQEYRLEPLVSGPAHVDPITIRFVDKRAAGDGKAHELETEALVIEVLSVVKNTPSLSMLKGLEGPQLIPENRRAWPWIVGGGLAACGIIGLVGYRRWKQRRRVVIPPTPQELAASELESLRQAGLDRNDIKGFYVELTGIVRRYIERTTGIQAPDQTTEEFLREIGSGSVFETSERQRLKDFLEAADLVKFAAYQPLPDDIDESYRRARIFVGLNVEQTI